MIATSAPPPEPRRSRPADHPFLRPELAAELRRFLGLFTAGSDGARWALVGMTALIAGFVTIWLLREKRLPTPPRWA
jgi:hypothetical protein